MSTDTGTLIRATSQDIVVGNRGELGAFADIVCKYKARQAAKGTEAFLPTKQVAGQEVTRDALGVLPKDRNINIGTYTYDFGRYHELLRLDKVQVRDLDQYMDTLSEFLKTIQKDVDTGIDSDLYTLLTSATFNNSHAAATGVWSLSTSTPVLDIQTAIDDFVPGADLVIMGKKTARKLARHPDFKEAVSHYAGSGSIPLSKIRDGVAEVLDMNPANVHIFGQYYNAANLGQTLDFSYIASDLFWAGFQESLVRHEDDYGQLLGEGTPSNAGIVTFEEEHNMIETAYGRVLDLNRPDKEAGVFITGTV